LDNVLTAPFRFSAPAHLPFLGTGKSRELYFCSQLSYHPRNLAARLYVGQCDSRHEQVNLSRSSLVNFDSKRAVTGQFTPAGQGRESSLNDLPNLCS
jgi:hypothetical protein